MKYRPKVICPYCKNQNTKRRNSYKTVEYCYCFDCNKSFKAYFDLQQKLKRQVAKMTQELPPCPYCKGNHTIKHGVQQNIQYYRCMDCKRCYSDRSRIYNKYPDCYICGGSHVRKSRLNDKKGTVAYFCNDCNKVFSEYTLTKPTDDGRKRCLCCKEYKTLDNFRPDSRYKYGYEHTCRYCKSHNALKTINRFKKYGITPQIYEHMLEQQGGKCAICKVTLNENVKTNAHIDHCHKTGIVRGLLCHACNKVLGFARDNIDILEESIKYLKIT